MNKNPLLTSANLVLTSYYISGSLQEAGSAGTGDAVDKTRPGRRRGRRSSAQAGERDGRLLLGLLHRPQRGDERHGTGIDEST